VEAGPHPIHGTKRAAGSRDEAVALQSKSPCHLWSKAAYLRSDTIGCTTYPTATTIPSSPQQMRDGRTYLLCSRFDIPIVSCARHSLTRPLTIISTLQNTDRRTKCRRHSNFALSYSHPTTITHGQFASRTEAFCEFFDARHQLRCETVVRYKLQVATGPPSCAWYLQKACLCIA
jgi:hypothetical protein